MSMFLIILLVSNLFAMPIYYLILKSRFNANKILREIRIEVDKLVLELGREADRDVALLESRIASLRSLMEETDRRILLADRDDLRRREIEIQKTMAPIINTEVYHTPEPEPEVTQKTVPVPVPPSKPVQKKSEPVVIYTRPIPSNNATFSESVIAPREAVLSLVKKGFSADLIASQLSLPLGEVELILDMNSSSL